MWYTLDAFMKISDVSADWETFAGENCGSGLTRRNVLGRQIWDFVNGLDTRSYLNAVFFWSRQTGSPLTLPYRCDSPDFRREFYMHIEPVDGGGIRVSHSLQKTAPHDVVTRIDLPGFIRQCSQCLRCKSHDGWMDTAFQVPIRHFPVNFVVCSDCRKVANRAISGEVLPFRTETN